MSKVTGLKCSFKAYLEAENPMVFHFQKELEKAFHDKLNIDLSINDKEIFSRYDKLVDITFKENFIIFNIDEPTVPDRISKEIVIHMDSIDSYCMHKYK